MSGQQIGTVVGAVVGAYFGVPQLGAAIGGYIGGVIDPTQINGPHIGEAQAQSAADGVPIPWILGTAPCVGNIAMAGPRYEVKVTDDGKGSTTEQNTFEAHQSFTILICESSETRDSVVTGIQMVRQNGKIVYDVRPGSAMLAESAKWKEKVTFYFGAEDQLPDPTMESIFGVGNTPANRGVCTAVFRDFNRSEFGDAIPQFEWVVVTEGSIAPTVTPYYAGRVSGFTNADWPLVDSESDYTYSGDWTTGLGAGVTSPSFDTIDEVLDWYANVQADTGATGTNVLGRPSYYVGYSGITSPNTGGQSSTDTFSGSATQPDVTDLSSILLLYQWQKPADGFTAYAPTDNAFCSIGSVPGPWLGAANGWILRRVTARTSFAYYQPTGTACLTEAIPALSIKAQRKRIGPIEGMPLPDLVGWFVGADGSLAPGHVETSGSFLVLSASHQVGSSPTRQFDYYENGPAMLASDPANTEATWTAAYDAAVAAGDLPAGWTYGVDYPEAIGSVWTNAAALPEIASGSVTLASVVQRINRRGGLADADIDVAELTDLVAGYPIVNQYNAVECIRPLAGCYFFKGIEYDAQIHFHKDGADADVIVDPQDFINGDDEDDQDKRGQAKEYPRLLTGSYLDPTLDYAIGKTKAQRRSPDVLAIGEASLQIPVVMAPDEAAQATDKALKIMWAKLQGTRKFSLPFGTAARNYLKMVPGIPFGLGGRRYVADQITVSDQQMLVECSYDRQSAYQSDVTAIPTLPPTPPVSTITGPTLFAAMNLPALRTQDSEPGMYVAACGLFNSWRGCTVRISFDDGATFVEKARITVPAVMGALTDAVTDSSEPISVGVYGGALFNASADQIAAGGNAFAILGDVAEIGQFQTQDETSPRQYDLTDTTRGVIGTVAAAHAAGERFVMLANSIFIPIDYQFAGQTLIFQPVGFGTSPDRASTYSVLYDPGELVEDGGSP